MAWGAERWRRIEGLEHGFGDRLNPSPAAVTTIRQVHGRVVHHVDDVTAGVTEGDGLATDRPGVRVGVWTADCVPVHLLAREARVAVAVHCGWRGSAAGILGAALDLLAARWGIAPRDVEAALGPSIGGCCYDVGAEIERAFVERAGARLGRVGFQLRDGRLFLDLRRFLDADLLALGVSRVEAIGPCTSCRSDVLHSYRKGSREGRQLSWIGWRTTT